MKDLEQFCVAAVMSAFIGVAFYYLTEDFLFLFFDFIGLIVLSVGIGIIAFILIALYYSKKNKEEKKKAEEKRIKKEERKRQREEKEKAEINGKQKKVMMKTVVAQNQPSESLKIINYEREQEMEKRVKELEERKKKELEKKRVEEETRKKEEEERKKKEEEAKSFDWNYDIDTQTLTITGQGHMPKDWHPWGKCIVKNIIIKNGVLSISPEAFSSRKLETRDSLRIDFGETLQIIGDEAFYGKWLDRMTVFPESLKTIGYKVFTNCMNTLCFKSQIPPTIADRQSLLNASVIMIPKGCLKSYVSSSENWQYLARITKEQDISEMHSSLELEAIEAEKKRQEEERKRAEEEERKRQEEARRKKEEEIIRKEEEKKKELIREKEEKKKQEEEAKKIAHKKELESFEWNYSIKTRTLTISGEGNMPQDWHPWPNNISVRKLIIKDGILSISANAFSNINLHSEDELKVDFGNTLVSIGNEAFMGQVMRKIYVFPESLSNIGTNAFGYSNGIFCFKSQNPPSIGADTFANSISLQIPSGSFKQYVSSSSEWSTLADRISECDISTLNSSKELKSIEDRIRKEEEDRRKKEEMEKEKIRKKEEERRKKEEEERERIRKEEEDRKKKEEMEKERIRKEEEDRRMKDEEERKKEEETFDWNYDSNTKTLYIAGHGHMPKNWHPWGSVKVNSIIIKDGVLSISPSTFHNLNSTTYLKVDFGNTLQSIEDKAFEGLLMYGIYVFPDSLKSIGAKVFTKQIDTVCFKSQYPPAVADLSLLEAREIIIPTGCVNDYISSSENWQNLAESIREKDISEMHSSLELEAIEAENKRQEEERIRKEDEEWERKKKEAEELLKKKEEGKKVDWNYDSNTKTLYITGRGHMPNNWHPWGSIKVNNIIIKDGVLSISPSAFKYLNSTNGELKVDFGNTLQSIGDNAFEGLSMYGIYVFPDSLKSIGAKVFTRQINTVCFKSQDPPVVADNCLVTANEIIIPTGCVKNYTSSSEIWQYLARSIKEKDISEMHSSLELEAIEVEKKRQEEEERKRQEEARRKDEEERKKKEEEERKREEERERNIEQAEEEAYRAQYEQKRRKEMGL